MVRTANKNENFRLFSIGKCKAPLRSGAFVLTSIADRHGYKDQDYLGGEHDSKEGG